MKIAFYAPLKAPDHPVPSGDRLIAGLLVRALERAGHEVALASRLRAFDGAGDRGRQRRLARIGRAEAQRLLDGWIGSPRAPRCWFTYHLYHKAPDWIGPRVSARLGIPYVVAEASYAPKQARGAWRHGHRAVAVALARAVRVIALNPDDVPGLEWLLGGLEGPVHGPRDFPDGVPGLERWLGGLEGPVHGPRGSPDDAPGLERRLGGLEGPVHGPRGSPDDMPDLERRLGGLEGPVHGPRGSPDDVPGLERLLGSLENSGRHPRDFPHDVPGLERRSGSGTRLRRLVPFIDTGACAPRGDRSRRRARIARLVCAGPSTPLLACVAMMRGGRKAESFGLLARALERIRRLSWHLLLVGDGPARPRVEAAFAELVAAGRVTFLGVRPPRALPGIVGACDLFVWPALGEPIGMAMLEAQALGVPVVAGDARGVGEVVVHGAGGWLVPEGDAAAFAGAVEKALADPAALAAAGAAARARVRAGHGLAAASRDLDRWIGEAVEEIEPAAASPGRRDTASRRPDRSWR